MVKLVTRLPSRTGLSEGGRPSWTVKKRRNWQRGNCLSVDRRDLSKTTTKIKSVEMEGKRIKPPEGPGFLPLSFPSEELPVIRKANEMKNIERRIFNPPSIHKELEENQEYMYNPNCNPFSCHPQTVPQKVAPYEGGGRKIRGRCFYLTKNLLHGTGGKPGTRGRLGAVA